MGIASVKAPAVAGPAAPAEPAIGSAGAFRLVLADVMPPETPRPVPQPVEHNLHDLYIQMFTRPVGDLGQRLEQQPYAEVKVGDTVIATVSNSGAVTTPNNSPFLTLIRSAGGKFLSGPELAQHMAETLAKAAGGTIVMSDSAATQAEWLSRPPLRWMVDYEAMNAFIERNRNQA